MWHLWGRGEVHTGFWWGKLRERNNLEDVGAGGKIFKWSSRSGIGAWTGLIWLRIGSGGGRL